MIASRFSAGETVQVDDFDQFNANWRADGHDIRAKRLGSAPKEHPMGYSTIANDG
jgi:hypothetical protein